MRKSIPQRWQNATRTSLSQSNQDPSSSSSQRSQGDITELEALDRMSSRRQEVLYGLGMRIKSWDSLEGISRSSFSTRPDLPLFTLIFFKLGIIGFASRWLLTAWNSLKGLAQQSLHQHGPNALLEQCWWLWEYILMVSLPNAGNPTFG